MSPDTKTALLDAAERLFAEHGFAATSLRQITAAAGANLAAVNYHFGSKEELAKAVLARRIAPINRERLRRLDDLPRPARLADVLRAFIEPALRHANEPHPTTRAGATESVGQNLCRVFGRMNMEQAPFLREFLAEQFRALEHRFVAMLQEAVPHAAIATLWLRMHFVVGGMAHVLQNATAIEAISDGTCRADDVDQLVDELVAFAVGGLAAAPNARAHSSRGVRTPAAAPRARRRAATSKGAR